MAIVCPARRCGSPIPRLSPTSSSCGPSPTRMTARSRGYRPGERHEGAIRTEDRRQAAAHCAPRSPVKNRHWMASLLARNSCCRASPGLKASRSAASIALAMAFPGVSLGAAEDCWQRTVQYGPRPQAVRTAAGRHTALPEEVRRHADRNYAWLAGFIARWPSHGRGPHSAGNDQPG